MGVGLFVSEGDRIDHTPVSAVAEGDVIVIGGRLCLATSPIAANSLGSLAIRGIFNLPKAAGVAVTAGELIYWHGPVTGINTTAAGALATLTAVFAAASADTRINVWV